MDREDWYAQLSTVNLHVVQIRQQIAREKERIANMGCDDAELEEAVEDLLLTERALRAYQDFRQRLIELLATRYPMVKEVEDVGTIS
jgi:hypothetical protein